jgi:hypothetical protein
MRRTVRFAAGIVGAAAIAVIAVSCDDSTGPSNKRYIANLNAAAEGGSVTSAGSGVVTFEDKGDLITWSMTLQHDERDSIAYSPRFGDERRSYRGPGDHQPLPAQPGAG